MEQTCCTYRQTPKWLKEDRPEHCLSVYNDYKEYKMSWSSLTSMFEVHSMQRKRADKENMLTEGQMNTRSNGQDDK